LIEKQGLYEKEWSKSQGVYMKYGEEGDRQKQVIFDEKLRKIHENLEEFGQNSNKIEGMRSNFIDPKKEPVNPKDYISTPFFSTSSFLSPSLSIDMSIPPGYYDDLEWINRRLSIQPFSPPFSFSLSSLSLQCPSLSRSILNEILKIILLISTLILVYQLLDRKRFEVNIKMREQSRKWLDGKRERERKEREKEKQDRIERIDRQTDRQTERQIEKELEDETPLYPSTTLLSLLSLHPNNFRPSFYLQLFIVLLIPLPFSSFFHISDRFSLLIWLRLCLSFRLIRDYSEIWLNRRFLRLKHSLSINNKSASSSLSTPSSFSNTPDFDWFLSCKTISYTSPLAFCLSFYLICIIVCGHCLYICEREYLYQLFDMKNSMFCAFHFVSLG
jgi:hypothetical protein